MHSAFKMSTYRESYGEKYPFSFDRREALEELHRKFPDSLASSLLLPQYRQFLEECFPIQAGDWVTFERLAMETSYFVQTRLQSEPESGAFRQFMEKRIPIHRLHDCAKGCTPFAIGLRWIFYDRLEDFQNLLSAPIGRYIDGCDSIIPTRYVAKSGIQERFGELFDDASLQFVFAPSGSGKTTSILHKFSHQYGYYMVSSALRAGNVGQNIMDPKILEGASRDTYELFQMLKWIEPLLEPYEEKVAWTSSLCQAWWANILDARHRVYSSFRQTGGPESSEKRWLSFQLSCGKWDPFLQVFRLLSLSMSSEPDEGLQLFDPDPWSDDPHPDPDKFMVVDWVCIDEAQEDLRYSLGGGKREQDTIFANALVSWSNHAKITDSAPGYFRQAIFAGTSFNISKAQELRASMAEDIGPWHPFFNDRSYRSVGNFPLIMKEADTKKVLSARGLKPPVLDMAAKHAHSLWGRIKWTAMFADKILEEPGGCNLSDNTVRGLAKGTYDTVIIHLMDRLRAVQQRGDGAELLNKLLEAAISADIRDSAHVFYQESDMELVHQGFATVTSKISQLVTDLATNFTIVSRRNDRASACRKTNRPLNDTIIDETEDALIYLLAKAAQGDLTIDGVQLNRLTPKMVKKGFTVVDIMMATLPEGGRKAFAAAQSAKKTRHDALKKTLSSHHLEIVTEGENTKWTRLSVRLKPDESMEVNTIHELPKELMKNRFCITSMVSRDLDKLMQNEFTFTVADLTLNAQINERVVIDAIIRFFLGNRLEEELIHSIIGASSRTGLGHPAEYFMAVQLRQFFTDSPLSSTASLHGGGQLQEEWKERRRRVLVSLGQAQNGQGQRIHGLEDSTLITGLQTVKKSDKTFPQWTSLLKRWLEDIENSRQPCASFLMPHNDFGPDLIFALRRKDKSPILCSIQSKLGGGGSDAVPKSSLSWACVGRRKEIEEKKKRHDAEKETLKRFTEDLKGWQEEPSLVPLKAFIKGQLDETQMRINKNEDTIQSNWKQREKLGALEDRLLGGDHKWKDESKLSLLIKAGRDAAVATGEYGKEGKEGKNGKKIKKSNEVKADQEDKEARPETGCNEAHEYFSVIGREPAEALFGRAFTGLLQALKD
ncbi:hypothetical protein B0T10DRAFT_607414 [Thelonectria olida]|uniref:Uncharacterized protein n=1 Tax=Thelonectria olida TaxID=1576542 RepID=A0A9P8W488_9HYPO|nr:hypothetical protein B0T10DRAFT_607414 [Thelonectria olida]